MTFPAAFTIMVNAVGDDPQMFITIVPLALVGTVVADLIYGLMKLICGR
jgi:hypothetical protein